MDGLSNGDVALDYHPIRTLDSDDSQSNTSHSEENDVLPGMTYTSDDSAEVIQSDSTYIDSDTPNYIAQNVHTKLDDDPTQQLLNEGKLQKSVNNLCQVNGQGLTHHISNGNMHVNSTNGLQFQRKFSSLLTERPVVHLQVNPAENQSFSSSSSSETEICGQFLRPAEFCDQIPCVNSHYEKLPQSVADEDDKNIADGTSGNCGENHHQTRDRFYVDDVPIDPKYKDAFFVQWNWPKIRQGCVLVNLSLLIGLLCVGIGLVVQMPRGRECDPPVEWWQGSTSLYVSVQSFRDSDTDGYGDVLGLISKLDHIHALGFRSVRLASIFEYDCKDTSQNRVQGHVHDQGHVQSRYQGHVQNLVQNPTHGHDQNRTRGHVQNRTPGHDQGHNQGHVQNLTQGHDQNRTPGHNQGHDQSLVQNLTHGHDQNRTQGHDQGHVHVQGHCNGHVDYSKVSPAIGDVKDIRLLAALLHEREMYLLLDIPIYGTSQSLLGELLQSLTMWLSYGVDGIFYVDWRQLDKNLTGVDSSLTGTDEKSTGVDSSLTGTDENLTGTDNISTGVDNKLTGTDNILTGTDKNLTGNDENLTGTDKNLTGTDENSTGVDGKSLEQIVHALSLWRKALNWRSHSMERKVLGVPLEFLKELQSHSRNLLDSALDCIDLIDFSIDLTRSAEEVSKTVNDVTKWDSSKSFPWINWRVLSSYPRDLELDLKVPFKVAGSSPGVPEDDFQPTDVFGWNFIPLFLPGSSSLSFHNQFFGGKIENLQSGLTSQSSRPDLQKLPGHEQGQGQLLDDLKALISTSQTEAPLYINGIFEDIGSFHPTKSSNYKVRLPGQNILLMERFFPRRNKFALVANLGHNLTRIDLSKYFYGGMTLASSQGKRGYVLFTEVVLLPSEVLVVLLDK